MLEECNYYQRVLPFNFDRGDIQKQKQKQKTTPIFQEGLVFFGILSAQLFGRRKGKCGACAG
jgi:hypothetical protein